MNDTIRQAEAHRRKAHEIRHLAQRCRSIHEREAFQRLAHGYDILAGQLEQMSRARPLFDDARWPVDTAEPGRHREHRTESRR